VGGGAGGASNHGAWLTLETVVALLTACEDTALLLEVGHADGWESRSTVVLSRVVVDLVDWDGGVNDVWLNDLLVDDWLDLLVNVVVDVLASDSGCGSLSVLHITLDGGVLELGSLCLETLLNLSIAAVLKLAVLDGSEVVVVLLGESLLVVDWLDRGVVVILVDLLVDDSGQVLVTVLVDGLVDDCWCNCLVDGGVIVASLAKVALNRCLCLVHFDD